MILGSVMVHEIGHLLLGPNSHSDFGTMQGLWGRKQIRLIMWGKLGFTAQQSKLLSEGQARLMLETTQTKVTMDLGGGS